MARGREEVSSPPRTAGAGGRTVGRGSQPGGVGGRWGPGAGGWWGHSLGLREGAVPVGEGGSATASVTRALGSSPSRGVTCGGEQADTEAGGAKRVQALSG